MSNALDINPSDMSAQLGAIPTIGGYCGDSISADINFTRDYDGSDTYHALYVTVGVGAPTNSGTLIFKDQDGQPVIRKGVTSGESVFLGKSIGLIHTVTNSKGTFTTDCGQISWFGGAK